MASLGIPQSPGTHIADSETSQELLQQLKNTGSLNESEITFLENKIALIEKNRDSLEKTVLYNDWKLENFFVDGDTVTVVDLGRVTKKKCLFEEFAGLYQLLPHQFVNEIVKAYETLSGTEIPEKDLMQKYQINDGNGWTHGGYSLHSLNGKLCDCIDGIKEGHLSLADIATQLRQHIQIFGNGPAPVLQKNRGDRSFFSREYL